MDKEDVAHIYNDYYLTIKKNKTHPWHGWTFISSFSNNTSSPFQEERKENLMETTHWVTNVWFVCFSLLSRKESHISNHLSGSQVSKWVKNPCLCRRYEFHLCASEDLLEEGMATTYSCLQNLWMWGAWQAAVHRTQESAQISDLMPACFFHPDNILFLLTPKCTLSLSLK